MGVFLSSSVGCSLVGPGTRAAMRCPSLDGEHPAMVYAPGGALPVAAMRSAGGDEAGCAGGAATELSGPTTRCPDVAGAGTAALTYAGKYLHNTGVGDGDTVFKALADPTRRALLDRLRERN